MANGFARLEFITRSKSRSILIKAEYNARTGPRFENEDLTLSSDKSSYTSRSGHWSSKDDCLHHEILLPKGADKKFLDIKHLWTAAEQKETRVNARIGIDLVIALPDDAVIHHEDRVELSRRFCRHFVDKGFIVQLNLHAPKQELTVQQPHRELGLKAGMKGDVLEQRPHQIVVEFEGRKTETFNPKEYTGYSISQVNHHAHLLVTPRCLKENGEAFEDKKPRALTEQFAQTRWGEVWTNIQNDFFKEKRLDLEVDPKGMIGQNHLGPRRMRGRHSEILLKKNIIIQELNQAACQNPEQLLAILTQEHPLFERKDVENFITKHAAKASLPSVRESFWKYTKIVPLYDKITGEKTSYYTTSDLVTNEQELKPAASHWIERAQAEEGNTIFYRMSPRAQVMLTEPLKEKALDPLILTKAEKLLEEVTYQHSVFSREDVKKIVDQYIPPSESKAVLERFWNQNQLVKLYQKDPVKGHHPETLLYSSLSVVKEEQDILTLSKHLYRKKHFEPPCQELDAQDLRALSCEQLQAYCQTIRDWRHLTLIQGDAGTGKSYLLKALQQTYQRAGYHVRALGPDHATCNALKEKELTHTQTLHSLLFHAYHTSNSITVGQEVWIVDEAGKMSNALLRELLCRSKEDGIPLVLAGDGKQFPSLQRGGGFNFLCQRYPSYTLKEIKRQHNPLHRQAAVSLAQGNADLGLDQLQASGAIHWREDVKGCMEALINRWALYTQEGDLDATLMLATSNRERRALNEMARAVRRHRKEITGQELECTTAYGKIYVAVGDRILFRKNNKSLGITNGMSGVLIEASPKRWTVSVRREDKSQQVVRFDPETFPFYDLGYASTTYSSQGRTVQHCFVMHGAYPSLQKLYVQATRHQMEVHLFVPSDRVKNFLQLKADYRVSRPKETTLSYVTSVALGKKGYYESQKREIDRLKEKRLSLSYVKGIYKQAQLKQEERKDQKEIEKRASLPHHAFYRYQEEKHKEGKAQPVKFGEPLFEMCKVSLVKPDPQEGVQKYWIQDLHTASQDVQERMTLETALELHQIKRVDQERKGSQTGERSSKALSHASESLHPASQTLVQSYHEGWKKAQVLSQLVEEEAKSMQIGREKTPSFHGWKEARLQRDQRAYAVCNTLTPDEKKAYFSEKGLEVLQERARSHARLLERQSSCSTLSLEERLKADLSYVLSRLFPDQRPRKAGNYLRYGTKGSLSICLSGSKMGQWKDFEHDMSGGVLKLIQVKMGLGKEEAKMWAEKMGRYLQKPRFITADYVKFSQEKEEAWISLKPTKDCMAPLLKNCGKVGEGLSLSYNEAARHAYRDENGDVLYYVLRLQLKEGDVTDGKAKKITPPLSYGYWMSAPDQLKWEIKGFKEEMRTLYNLHLLKEHPAAKVVIVEGEKTADCAPEKFPQKNYIFITSSGGAGAAARSDWTPLIGREVVVWPDHDTAGLKYAEDVCRELRRVGVRSLQRVDLTKLGDKFPEKWDLADPLPPGVGLHDLGWMLLSGEKKAVDVESAMREMKLNVQDLVLRHRVHEILWRVDERLRAGLEDKGLRGYDLQDTIIRETKRIYEGNSPGEGRFNDIGYQACIVQAMTGRAAQGHELEMVKKAFHQEGGYQEGGKALSKEIDPVAAQIWKDTRLSHQLEKNLGVRDEKKVGPSLKEVEEIQRNLEKQQQQRMIAQHIKEQHRILGQGIEH